MVDWLISLLLIYFQMFLSDSLCSIIHVHIFWKKQIGDCQTHLERRFTIDRVVSWAVVHDAEVVVGVPPGRTLRRLTYPELVDGGGGQVSRHHLYVLVTVQATLCGGKGNGLLCLFKVRIKMPMSKLLGTLKIVRATWPFLKTDMRHEAYRHGNTY